jgi:uncharacterized protein (TIGR02453 family)
VKFAGFPDQALVFYEGLEADNSKPYWTDHKPEYETCVRAPMEALLAELEPEFGSWKLFRPYRDVRFSKDKTPYKTSIAAVAGSAPAGTLYVQLSANGLVVGGGIRHPAPDQLERLRRAVADDVQGAALHRAVTALGKTGYEVDGDRMTRPPRGYPADHPRAEMLRYRSVVAYRTWLPEPWLHDRTALRRVRDGWRALAPLNTWIAANLGAPG